MNRSLCSWLRWHGDVKLDNSKVCRLSCNMQIFSLYLRVLNISLPFKTIIFSHFKYYFILFITLISPITHEVTVQSQNQIQKMFIFLGQFVSYYTKKPQDYLNSVKKQISPTFLCAQYAPNSIQLRKDTANQVLLVTSPCPRP